MTSTGSEMNNKQNTTNGIQKRAVCSTHIEKRKRKFRKRTLSSKTSCESCISKRAQIDETVILNENLEDDHTRGLSLIKFIRGNIIGNYSNAFSFF